MKAITALAAYRAFYEAWFEFKEWPGFINPDDTSTVWFSKDAAQEILGYFEEVEEVPGGLLVNAYEDTYTVWSKLIDGEILYPLGGYLFTIKIK